MLGLTAAVTAPFPLSAEALGWLEAATCRLPTDDRTHQPPSATGRN
jgi:hypothetical protein